MKFIRLGLWGASLLAVAAAMGCAPEQVGELGTVTNYLPAGFTSEVVFSGLTLPTSVRFTGSGHVFVAEKAGIIKVFEGLTDTTATVVADLRPEVYNWADRGLLDIIPDPQYPTRPYLYALYTLDGRPGDSVQAGTVPRYGDNCTMGDGGCSCAGRLVRLTLSPVTHTIQGQPALLIENWAMQFPSHSIGSLAWGPDGYLYVSGGDGASFNGVDYGNFFGNPFGDPPNASQALTPPTAMGGALRSQILVPPAATPPFPTWFGGKVIRIDPETMIPLLDPRAMPAPPPRVASGLRNPFRMTFRPGTNELWVGDVGWRDWEEINRIPNVTASGTTNFGWPCYEGVGRQGGYEATQLDVCTSLYASAGAATAPFYTYDHALEVVPGDGCQAPGGGAVSGLAFYSGTQYPAQYQGALFFADYARQCIWYMPLGAGGLPNPAQRTPFVVRQGTPVQLQIGPGGDLFYVDLIGFIRRVRFSSGNNPPHAVATANVTSGPTPLQVTFSAAGSSDTDPGSMLFYAWDLDGDGQYDDSTAVNPMFTYVNPGTVNVGLRVTDQLGASSTASVSIVPGQNAPVPSIQLTGGTSWKTGDVISFTGSATDVEEGTIGPAGFQWVITLQHCPAGVCHPHILQQLSAVVGGSVVAPDHDYPSHLEIMLVVTDSAGVSGSRTVQLLPQTIDMTLSTNPPGLRLGLNSEAATAPFTRTLILNSTGSVAAPNQTVGGVAYRFVSWSDGGAASHNVAVGPATANLTAQFEVVPVANLAFQGTPVALITSPFGGGNRDINVIRDGVKPPVGTTANDQQYDTYAGGGPRPVDWIGYTFPSVFSFEWVVFQEGHNFTDGGFFNSVGVEVRQSGSWVAVPGVQIVPTYPGNNGVNYETFTLTLPAGVAGDGLRIVGPPGGAAAFISVGELEVYGAPAEGVNLPPVANAGPDQTVGFGAAVTLSAAGSSDPNGDALSYAWSQTGGTPVTLGGATTATPSFTAPGAAATLTFSLVVSDGTLQSAADTVVVNVGTPSTPNIMSLGTPVALIMAPFGGGNKDLNVIRDGVKPPVGSTADNQQYDTYAGGGPRPVDWIGYTFPSTYAFDRVVFQEGKNFGDGGFFTSLGVEVRQGTSWVAVPGLQVTPVYSGGNSIHYETFDIRFPAVAGTGIRIVGPPGGSARFISVGELEVYGVPAMGVNLPPVANAGPDQTVGFGAAVTLTGAGSSDPNGDMLTYAWSQTGGTAVTLSGAATATPSFTAPGAAATLTFSLVVSDGTLQSAADTVVVNVSPPGSPNITAQGTAVALIMSPTGGGNKSLTVIRDGVKPAVGSTADNQQYDTYAGGGPRPVDWIGYTFPSTYAFDRVVFQEGKNFGDGGFFTTLSVEVRQGAAWVAVSGLQVTPAYSGGNGVHYETFDLRFPAVAGDGIRIAGPPGGAARFISVGELEVYGVPAMGVNLPPVANAGPDQTVGFGAAVTLTGAGSSDPNGDALTYAWSQTGGTAVTLSGATTATPSFTAPGAAATLTFSLVVSDGTLQSAADTVVVNVSPPGSPNITAQGTAVALIMSPTGGGNKSLTVIRDGVKPPVGSTADNQQYDTYAGGGPRPVDWIGYTFSSAFSFDRVVFQEGKNFVDGGFFTTFGVEVRQGGSWVAVPGLQVTPAYPGGNGVHYETFDLRFPAIVGDGIRIAGPPGGAARFISVGELEVYGGPAMGVNLPPVANAGPDQTVALGAAVTLTGAGSSDPNGDALTYAWSQTGGTAVTLSGATTATPSFTAPAASATLTFSLTVSDGTLQSTADTVVVNVSAPNMAPQGTPVAFIMSPTGGGNKDLNVIRDGVKPPVGSTADNQQYDTYAGGGPRSLDWVGYTFSSNRAFNRVVFQEGKNFGDGGFFTTLTVEVRQGSTWSAVPGVVVTPAYSGGNGVHYETFQFTFPAITGNGIRISGTPGGSARFISVGELEVYGN